ncbi:hyper-sensitivity-related 4-like protein [Tanacetum coccineum]
MFSYENLPPPKTILTTAASLTASAVLFKSLAADIIPFDINEYFKTCFRRFSSELTIVIQESDGLTPNHLFESANLYLGSKVSPLTRRIKVQKPEKDEQFTVTVDRYQVIVDVFQNVKCKWVLQTERVEVGHNSNAKPEIKYFELSFHKKHKETMLRKYLGYVVRKAKEIKEESKAVKLHTVDYNGTDYWSSVVLNHPATFKTMAMDEEKKVEIMEDLDLFIRRKEYYRRVGKAWKRGYLFYGPPGTGKSSLVAAMANYLKFDVYDLDLREVQCNSDLRRLLIGTKNRSIIVIEDIDCNVGVQSRELDQEPNDDDKVPTLSY